jgi:hypothetical protein
MSDQQAENPSRGDLTRRDLICRSLAAAAAAGVIASPWAGAAGCDEAGGAVPAAGGGAAGVRSAGGPSSAASGRWSDAATWGGVVPGAGDVPRVAAGHAVIFDVDGARTAGLLVEAGATLAFDPDAAASLECTGNVVVEGTLRMRPARADVAHALRFRDVDESRFTGGGMDPVAGDVGLWVVGDGALDLLGAAKTAWTRAAGSVRAGAGAFAVEDAAGWRVGDTVVIVPTDTPPEDGYDWDDAADAPRDPFAPKFERRTIAAVDGNAVSLDAPLAFDHLEVTAHAGKRWTAEVANLSRNVRVEGAPGGRAHVFVRSRVPQQVRYVEGRHLGPRKVQDGSSRPQLVQGRYALHFHHCMDGSRGSLVEGCALYDVGNRAYVPHMSHGITMRGNVSFASMEPGFWWDFQEVSHDTKWDGNLVALVYGNGVDRSTFGMTFGQGDGNVARRNVVAYGHHGDPHNHGGYVWDADNEGVWVFEGNLSHSNRCGLFVWQNTGLNHTIVDHESYNDVVAIFHGAYANAYTYTGGYVYGGVVEVKATSGNSSGVRFERVTFDGGGRLPFCVDVFPSPATSGVDHNAFRECTFRNAAVAVRMNTFPIGDENTRKHVDLILCAFEDVGHPTAFTPESTPDSSFQIQPPPPPAGGERPTRVVHATQDAPERIEPFAPYRYGTGTGLTGRYFNGADFDRPAFARTDPMVTFQQWSFDRAASPVGVHHLITSDAFSVRWTGRVEAHYTAPHRFRVQGGGGFRLWVDGRLVLDAWSERADNADYVDSAPVEMTAGRQYDLRLETFNTAGARGCQLYWTCDAIGRMVHVPQSQLYPERRGEAPGPAGDGGRR